QFGPLIQFPILFGDAFMDSTASTALQVVPHIGLSAGCFCVLSLGVDRLLSVAMIKKYSNISRTRYFSAHLLSMAVFSSFTVYLLIAYYVP
ncbi:hypothetical protein PFISCL1PPCAC_13852, partial [Pristionchus fissidentatus]